MPNWCANDVKASKKVLDMIFNKETGKATFQKLMPMPKELNITSGGYEDESIFYAIIKKESSEREKLLKQIEEKNFNYYNKIAKYLGENKNIQEDFNKINENYKPGAEEMKLGIKNLEELGNAYISNIINYGFPDWYEWCNANWGTKWEADHIAGSPEEGYLVFDTAWNPPIGIVAKLFEIFPEEDIDWYYEEPGMDFAGNYTPDYEGGFIDTPCPVQNYEEEMEEETE